jgi:HEAT repeat protein
VDTYVGGRWRPAEGVTDLGDVSAPEAARLLIGLAASAGGAGEHAVFPATLADSVIVWPELLRLARDTSVPAGTRRSAVFWLGQAAGDAATRGLADLVDDGGVDRSVQEHAVFALSQRPADEGVPALIRIARTHRDPEVRKKALFWLGQSGDPRALALFEEILLRRP